MIKRQEGYQLKNIEGVYHLLPFGQKVADQKRGITMNETGVFLWNALETPRTDEELICLVAEYYGITESEEKEQLKKDFQGQEEDIANMQQVIDSGSIGAKKKEVWLSLGITLCVILANEVDGLEWRTLIDGNREAPVLTSVAGDTVIDPMKLVWSIVIAGEPCKLAEVYRNLLS